MKNLPISFTLAATLCALPLASQAQTTTYNGNGNYGFNGTPGDGPVGGGMLTFSSAGATISGTIAPGPNNGAGANGQLYDELVIYIGTGGTSGFNSTSTLTDTTTNNAILAEAVSGYNGAKRATADLGFFAGYAIAISPTQAQSGELFGLTSAGAFTPLQNVNVSPVGSAGNPDYVFSFSLANIGSPTGFQFSTTYLNAHGDIYRSDEAFNTVTNTATGATSGNPANSEVTLGVDTFGTLAGVPEPSTWAMTLGGVGMLGSFAKRRRQS